MIYLIMFVMLIQLKWIFSFIHKFHKKYLYFQKPYMQFNKINVESDQKLSWVSFDKKKHFHFLFQLMHGWFYDDGWVLLENELVAFISLICHFGMWQTGQALRLMKIDLSVLLVLFVSGCHGIYGTIEIDGSICVTIIKNWSSTRWICGMINYLSHYMLLFTLNFNAIPNDAFDNISNTVTTTMEKQFQIIIFFRFVVSRSLCEKAFIYKSKLNHVIMCLTHYSRFTCTIWIQITK